MIADAVIVMSSDDRPVRRRRKRDNVKANEQKATAQPRDITGKWRKKVNELADRLGWQRIALWNRYEDLACMVEYEMRLSRPIAEDSGFRLLRAMYDKLELAQDVQ